MRHLNRIINLGMLTARPTPLLRCTETVGMEKVMKLILVNVTAARILASEVYSFSREVNLFELYGTDDMEITMFVFGLKEIS